MSFQEIEKLRQEVQKIVLKTLGIKSVDTDLYLLIDIPCDDDKKLGEDISVLRHSSGYTKLSDISGIVSGINSNFEDQIQWLRIFLHKKFQENSKVATDKIKATIDEFFIRRF